MNVKIGIEKVGSINTIKIEMKDVSIDEVASKCVDIWKTFMTEDKDKHFYRQFDKLDKIITLISQYKPQSQEELNLISNIAKIINSYEKLPYYEYY